VMARNQALVTAGRRVLCAALGVKAPCPEGMLGSLAAVRLPDAEGPARSFLSTDPLQDVLLAEKAIEVPIFRWPAAPARWLRISAQLYNSVEQYSFLAESLLEVLARGASPRAVG
jgi:isopenicillin-N epimerase